MRGELDSVGEQVLQDLLEALWIAVHRSRQIIREIDVERQILGFGDVPEVPVDILTKTVEADLFNVDGDCSGLDFRKIENVVNKIEQIGAGGVDVPGNLHLLARQIARGVFGELLA